MERAQAIHCADNSQPKDCTRCLKLEPGTPPLWCALHGYACWHRYNPVEEAQVAMALAEMGKRRAAGLAKWDNAVEEIPHSAPPVALVAECRESLVSHGCEVQEGY